MRVRSIGHRTTVASPCYRTAANCDPSTIAQRPKREQPCAGVPVRLASGSSRVDAPSARIMSGRTPPPNSAATESLHLACQIVVAPPRVSLEAERSSVAPCHSERSTEGWCCCHSERRRESPDVVIPSGAPKVRRRGIAVVPTERPLYPDGCDSSPAPLRGSARNDMVVPRLRAPRVGRGVPHPPCTELDRTPLRARLGSCTMAGLTRTIRGNDDALDTGWA